MPSKKMIRGTSVFFFYGSPHFVHGNFYNKALYHKS